MKKSFFLLFFLFVPSAILADMIIGGETVYYVVEGDTLELIGAKLGVDWRNLVKENKIDLKKHLRIGQEIRANTRKIVPKTISDGIIVNIPDRMLYFFKEGKLVTFFPVGLGKPTWKTAIGRFKVIYKEKNPTWHVPESIQKEMEKKGEPVKVIVSPGPDNPLGRYAVKISTPGILIHETIWPTSVYQFRSHGCIRVLPQHMEKFFKELEINTQGEIIYNPVKIVVTDNSRVFLEVHRDIYGMVKDLSAETRGMLERAGVAEKVNWQKVEMVLKEKSGIAEDITL